MERTAGYQTQIMVSLYRFTNRQEVQLQQRLFRLVEEKVKY